MRKARGIHLEQVGRSAPGCVRSRLFKLDSIDNVGGIILGDGHCPVRHRMCSDILASTHWMPGAPFLSRDNQKCLRMLPHVLRGTCSLPTENPRCRFETSFPWSQICQEESGVEGL